MCKIFTSAKTYKRFKMAYILNNFSTPPVINYYKDYIKTNPLQLTKYKLNKFNIIKYQNDCYLSQSVFAYFTLNIFAILPISDKCERLFNSIKILLKDRRSRLQIDIIKVNKSLRHLYRPPLKGTFDNKDITEVEAEEGTTQIALFNKYKAAVAEISKKLATYNKEGDKTKAKANY